MALYRAHVFGSDGQIIKRYGFPASDDKSALEQARQYLDNTTVEVWQLERLVDTLKTSCEPSGLSIQAETTRDA